MEYMKKKILIFIPILAFGALIFGLPGCTERDSTNQQARLLEDLERTITEISERRAHEIAIIETEKYAISILEKNKAKSNSQGMKNKLQDEIRFKRAVLFKAKKNISNQDQILAILKFKQDSILKSIESGLDEGGLD